MKLSCYYCPEILLISAYLPDFFIPVVAGLKNKKISNDQELIQSDPISCPQNQKGNN